MNTGNWKTATSGRDRKKRAADKSTFGKTAKDVDAQSKYDPAAPNPFDAIGSDQPQDTSTEKQILARPDPSKETTLTQKDLRQCVFASSDGDEIVIEAPRMAHIPVKAKACEQKIQSKLRDAPTRLQWGDQSDDDEPTVADNDRFEQLLRAFNADLNTACGSFEAKLEYIGGFASAILKRGLSLIKDKKRDVEINAPSEKELVNDLHVICTHGKNIARKVEECTRGITAIVSECETKKNTTLDELKNFLLGMTNEKSNKKLETRSRDPPLANYVSGESKVVKSASDLFSGKYSAIVARDDTMVSRNVDMASIPFPLTNGSSANLVVPLARRDTRGVSDMQPMSIKFAADLSVFLINLDGKTYSFCNGVFVSRPSKTGDNTLYGKRCNPGVARCIGAECTYYHDPLTHTPGHTSRNMGVHYVVSELLSGVSTDTDIAETARGRNKYVVEDIVQLAGMLLIKAFLVKKAREDLSNRDGNDA